MITAGWVGLSFQNLFGGAVSQNVAHTTALVAGLGSGVGAVLHDMTHLDKQQNLGLICAQIRDWCGVH